MKQLLLLAIIILYAITGYGQTNKPKFTTAGYFSIPETGREVYSMNQAWRFHKGDVAGTPYATNYADNDWQVVHIPHGLEVLPLDASGCINYQGIAWYRKHFTDRKSVV